MNFQSIKNQLLKDVRYSVGILLVIISAAIYFLCSPQTEDALVGMFAVNYLFTLGYWMYLIICAFMRTYRFHYIFPALVLSLISAYSLNRMMNVFDASPLWLTISLVVVSAVSLSLIFLNRMSRLLSTLIMIIIGVAMILFLYLSIYLIPIFPYCLLFSLGGGLSLHGLVPLIFLTFLIIWIFKYAKCDKKAFWGLAIGIIGVLIGTGIYVRQWKEVVSNMNDTYFETFAEDDVTLPAWVRVAQRIPKNDMTDKALKVGLTYLFLDYSDWNFNWMGASGFTEQKIHDPFVVIAGLLEGKPAMNKDEKIKILESIYDCRQQAAERLWSDEGIETSRLNSSVLIWPQYRMAYTEQVIRVRNIKDRWRGGEAVYTFYLPEGSVVTSLSLWVKGMEEKGKLTAKNKADSAYRTIVGVESRDPSLVHWQEGSTVRVRVFPVTRDEERTFKIGITSPLQKQDGQLVYKPLYFAGTNYTKAEEKITVKMMQDPAQFVFPSFFKRNATGLETPKYRKYDPQWEISMQETELSNDPFCFDGNCYRVQKIQSQKTPVDIQNIYLDINRSWNKREFNNIYGIVKDRKIRVYDGQRMITVTPENKDLVFQQLSQFQFSLFPIHLIDLPTQSLLISKSSEVSPNLSDLEGTPFFNSLKENAQRIYFFNLGNELSPYLKTFREYRVLNYCSGNPDDLLKMLKENSFEEVVETDHRAAVHDAGIFIEKQKGPENSKAPDHLMRLFAYNHIMLQYARSWNAASPLTDSLTAEAHRAYVVSPVSSLVVLETQKDYDRFNIEDIDISLGNASKKSNDAPIGDLNVWEIIVLSAMMMLYFYLKKK